MERYIIKFCNYNKHYKLIDTTLPIDSFESIILWSNSKKILEDEIILLEKKDKHPRFEQISLFNY